MKKNESFFVEESPTQVVKNYFLNPYERKFDSVSFDEEKIIFPSGTGPNCLR